MTIIQKLKNKSATLKGHVLKISKDLCYEVAILASAHYLYYHFF